MGMGIERAKRLKKEWESKLKKDPELKCTHSNGLEKEYYFGMQTGDYICPICGETFTLEEKKRMGK